MKLLVDAHLPRRLCVLLAQHGHDARHTLDLPSGNTTKDRVINQFSFDEQRIVVSKDTDFFYSHLLQGRPWKLLLVKTGSISTGDLQALFEHNLSAIDAAFQAHTLVQATKEDVLPRWSYVHWPLKLKRRTDEVKDENQPKDDALEVLGRRIMNSVFSDRVRSLPARGGFRGNDGGRDTGGHRSTRRRCVQQV